MSFFFSCTGKASQKKTVSLHSVETRLYPSTPFSHHSMDTLLRFTIENFRSIAEQKSIVLTPDSQVEELAENVAVQGEHRYFRTAAIYGANSSGKSNVVLGLAMMKHLVDSSVKMNNGEALTYDPFALNAEKAQSPTLYELDFLSIIAMDFLTLLRRFAKNGSSASMKPARRLNFSTAMKKV